MPRMMIELDRTTMDLLLDLAADERRPPKWQAEVVIQAALQTLFPSKDTAPTLDRDTEDQEP